MRILQTSDNHLDQVAYSKVDAETGLNVRGIDYLNAFRNIGKTALNEQVDVLLSLVIYLRIPIRTSIMY